MTREDRLSFVAAVVLVLICFLIAFWTDVAAQVKRIAEWVLE